MAGGWSLIADSSAGVLGGCLSRQEVVHDLSSIWLDVVELQATIIILLFDESRGCFQVAQGYKLVKSPCNMFNLLGMVLAVVQTTWD